MRPASFRSGKVFHRKDSGTLLWRVLCARLAPLDPGYFCPIGFALLGMKEESMFAKKFLAVYSIVLLLGLSACTNSATKSPDVSTDVRTALDTAGYKDVSVSQDRDKGVVTLNGKVASDADKTQAESIAKSHAAGQVVANQIAVIPPDDKSDAKAINSDIDKGIEKNLDAALIQGDLDKQGVKFDVKNAVVTLTGNVPTQSVRQKAEKTASTVPNVQQVVNEIEVKNQKATTSSQ